LTDGGEIRLTELQLHFRALHASAGTGA
jgi:hypothetical protein